MKKYTVLLLRPDYIADNYGEDTYMDHVNAESVEQAQAAAQKRAAVFDCPEYDADNETKQELDLVNHKDYAVLMVIEGHHNDIKEV